MYGKPVISVQATACTENKWFPFFNREPDVKLSVRRCRVQGSFQKDVSFSTIVDVFRVHWE